jgi:hypothetical protein
MARLATIGDYLAESRRLLQDEIVPYRYSDVDLVEALNLCLMEVRRTRPDLLLPRFEIPSVDPVGFNPTDPVVFEEMYRTAVVYYMVGRIQLRDDENTQDARAASLLNKFLANMLTTQS